MASSIDFNKARMIVNADPYMYGSTAAKRARYNTQTAAAEVYEEPVRRRKNDRDINKKTGVDKQTIKEYHKANILNLCYTVAISALVVAMFFFCQRYLIMKTSVTANQSMIASMQQELYKVTKSNDEEEVKINASIDYDQIFNIAINELNMVYPNKNQVITYDAAVSEYVKQYKNVPQAKSR